MRCQLLHILNLDTIGGVEHLFVNYIRQATDCDHYVSIPGKAPHKNFQIQAKKILRERPFMLPKALGVYRRQKLIDSIKNPHIVFWNRIEDKIAKGARTTYYEHGASWMGSVTTQKLAFLNSVDGAIAVSIAAREMLKQRWAYSKPITVIPNPRRPDIPIALTSKKLTSNRRIRLGFIGRLIPLKGVPITLHILKQLHAQGVDAELVIAGTGCESLRELITQLNLTNYVTILNNVVDVVTWYDSIDILLIPSIREPLGLIAVEAAARGVPVLASATDGLPEVASGICLETTLPIQEYEHLGGRIRNLPEVVYNPKTQTLCAPRILDPKLAASNLITIINDYSSYSKAALAKATLHPTFPAYVSALTSQFT